MNAFPFISTLGQTMSKGAIGCSFSMQKLLATILIAG
jgi:hypothetical protein